MSITEFIRRNKDLIDDVIRSNGGQYFSNEERQLWVLNDEFLYKLACKNRVTYSGELI